MSGLMLIPSPPISTSAPPASLLTTTTAAAPAACARSTCVGREDHIFKLKKQNIVVSYQMESYISIPVVDDHHGGGARRLGPQHLQQGPEAVLQRRMNITQMKDSLGC